MKKLISEKTIEQAFAAGKMTLELDPDSIVTPQAEQAASNLGVELVRKTSRKFSYTDRQKIVDAVLKRFQGGQFSRAKIEKAVKDILNSSL